MTAKFDCGSPPVSFARLFAAGARQTETRTALHELEGTREPKAQAGDVQLTQVGPVHLEMIFMTLETNWLMVQQLSVESYVRGWSLH
jgi:hypothetical protein